MRVWIELLVDGQLKAYLKYTRTTVLRITDLPMIKKGQSQNSHRKKKEILPLNESRISMGQDTEKKRAENSPQPVHLQAPTFKFFSLLMNETITFIFQTKAHERVKGGDSLIKGWVRTRHNKPSQASPCVYHLPFVLYGKKALEQRSPQLMHLKTARLEWWRFWFIWWDLFEWEWKRKMEKHGRVWTATQGDVTGNQTETNRKGLEVLVVAKGAPLWVTAVSRFVM